MANEQIITCGDGITLRTTDDGTALCTGDCENAPPPCCPSVCGERFRACLHEYQAEVVRVMTYGGGCSLPNGELGSGGGVHARTRRVFMRATPIRLDAGDVGVCYASAPVPMRDEDESRWDGDPRCFPDDFFRLLSGCSTVTAGCPGDPVQNSTMAPAPLPVPYPDGVLSAGPIDAIEYSFPDDAPRPGWMQLGSGTYSRSGVNWPFTAISTTPTTFTGTLSHSWSFRDRGDGSYEYQLTSTFIEDGIPDEPIVQLGSFQTILRYQLRKTLRIRLVYIPITRCDGSPGPHYICDEPEHDCDEDLEYIQAAPCVGQGSEVPPVVFLARNVVACRTMGVGPFCYSVGPTYPRTNDPGNATIDYRLVMAHSGFPDCCACLFCGNTITRYPCWQNFARSPDGTPIITPAFIEDGHCCCDPFDTITIAQADNTLIGFGQRQEWRLRGAPLSFLRNRVEAVPGNELISDVAVYDENAPDNAPPISTFAFNHGQFLNDPPMGCQWDQLGSTFFQFATPADGLPAAPIGVNGALPCPTDPNGERGAWRLILWSVSVTCRTFAFQGQWINTGNGLRLTTRTQFNVTPPADAEFRRCGGGCAKRPVGDFTAPGPLRPALPGPMGIGDLRNIIGGGGG